MANPFDNVRHLLDKGKLDEAFLNQGAFGGEDNTPREIAQRRKEMEAMGFQRVPDGKSVPTGADSRWETTRVQVEVPDYGSDATTGSNTVNESLRELYYRPMPSTPSAQTPAQAKTATTPAAAQNDPPPRFSVGDYTEGGDTGKGFAGSYVDSMLKRGAGAVSGVAATASPDYDSFLQRKSAEDERVANQGRGVVSGGENAETSAWEPGERGRIAYNERETTRAGELAARPFSADAPESQRFADSPEFRASLKEREDRLNRTYSNLFS